MKINLSRNLAFAIASLIASTAYGQTQVPNTFQSGQPALAAEVNANFSELELAANQNASDVAANFADISTNAADIVALGINTQTTLDTNSSSVTGLKAIVDDHEMRTHYLEDDMDLVLDRVIPCGDYRLYGCVESISADGTLFQRYYFAGGIYNVAFYVDPSAAVPGDSVFFAIPTADEFDFANLWIGGSSNLTRNLSPDLNEVLVNDCDNPTVEFVRTGEPPSSRFVVNNGNFYRRTSGGPILNTVDVTGQTYGLINHQTPGNIIEACTMVTDQTGLYDSYDIQLKFNVFDGRFDSPWTHQ